MVQGQTSGEWVSIGTYNLKKGTPAIVEFSNENADGHRSSGCRALGTGKVITGPVLTGAGPF